MNQMAFTHLKWYVLLNRQTVNYYELGVCLLFVLLLCFRGASLPLRPATSTSTMTMTMVTMASPPPTDVGCASQTSPSYYTHTHTYSHSINYPIGSRLSNNPFLQRRRSLASSIYTFQYSSLDDEIHEKQNGTSRNEDSRSPLPPRRSNRLYSIVIITTGILLPSHATTISRSIINH